jgi:hypothetical protein
VSKKEKSKLNVIRMKQKKKKKEKVTELCLPTGNVSDLFSG